MFLLIPFGVVNTQGFAWQFLCIFILLFLLVLVLLVLVLVLLVLVLVLLLLSYGRTNVCQEK